MDKKDISADLINKLQELEDKYRLTGQDLLSNLEGLKHANYLKYWEYIHLDVLLSLQKPRTDFPDEKIFIIYHQITELYFNLILWEIDQIADAESLHSAFFLDRVQRINRYLNNLVHSMDIMVDGMDKDQFRKFRMALLPSSGFQSAQFRKIEICSTDFINLLDQKFQNPLSAKADVEEVFPYLYWTQGASDADTGNVTITSQHFQDHYQEAFIDLAKEYRDKNLWQQYLKLTPDPLTNDIKKAMRELDTLMNIQWRLGHFKAAARHLKKKDQEEISSTGGTNWQKYLPPRFQKVIFYPRLWEEDELKNWGRNWEDLYDD